MKLVISIAVFLILLHAPKIVLGNIENQSQLPGKLPVPEIETLSNGLKVVWFIKDTLPVLDISLSVKVGYRDDPPGKSGTLELLTATLDRGSSGLSGQEMNLRGQSLGAVHKIVADGDSTSIGIHGLALDSGELLGLLKSYALHPDFPENEIKRERMKRVDQWAHLSDFPDLLNLLVYQKIGLADTSYGRGNLDSKKELNGITREDIVQFYKKFFTPKNSILMIVGNADRSTLREKVVASLGQWQGEEPQHISKNYKSLKFLPKKEKVVVVDRASENQVQVRIGFKAPLIRDSQHHALMIGNALLGDYFDSRLNKLIRDKLNLTYSIQSRFEFKKDSALWTITTSSRYENVGQLITNVIDVLANLKKGMITDEEVEAGKTYLKGGFPLATSTLDAVASHWLSLHLYGLDQNYLDNFISHIEQVKTQQVKEVMTKYLDLDHLIIVLTGDEKKIARILQKSKMNPIKKISITDINS